MASARTAVPSLANDIIIAPLKPPLCLLLLSSGAGTSTGMNSRGQKLTNVLDEPKEVRRIGRGGAKRQMLIELAGWAVLGVNGEGANPRDVGCLQCPTRNAEQSPRSPCFPTSRQSSSAPRRPAPG